jgi:ribosome-associated protein
MKRPSRPKRRPASRPLLSSAPAQNPRALATARQIALLALDKKATEVIVLDVRGMTSYADYFVICSGESERQVSATAEHVFEQLKAGGSSPLGFEGFEGGHWVLLDYGEVVAHFFHSEARAFYDLEGLWADAPREKVA